eukprot:scaffold46541_cov57-Phaeocystis_antarctica.AAC.6
MSGDILKIAVAVSRLAPIVTLRQSAAMQITCKTSRPPSATRPPARGGWSAWCTQSPCERQYLSAHGPQRSKSQPLVAQRCISASGARRLRLSRTLSPRRPWHASQNHRPSYWRCTTCGSAGSMMWPTVSPPDVQR